MKQITLSIKDFFDIPGAVIYNPDEFKDVTIVSIDTRVIKKNSLFIAIKGEKFDGHNFINTAVKKGAAAIMINKNYLQSIDDIDIPVITVPDTIKALGDVAKIWRSKLNAKVIGLTGSSGKTTTKEILARQLAVKFKVNKTSANNNNHIGVPLTILSTTSTDQVLVAECGTNHFGEIAYTANILQPDYALITNIGDSHLEFLKNRQGVLKEKLALFDVTSKRKGKLFINVDDELICIASGKYRNKIKYGFDGKAEIKGKILSYDSIGKARLELTSNSKRINLTVPLPGESNAKNFLAASAVCLELGLGKKELISSSLKMKSADKRLNLKIYKNFSLIDDTYNANPDSMRAAISILSLYKNRRRKIAILGEMFELGKQSQKLHEELAEYVKTQNIHEVYTIGNMMKHFSRKLKKYSAVIEHFESREELKKYLKKINLHNSIILIKGSRGMKMEYFVSQLESRAC
ncbi:MAG: UDP-N-acetylmuramoyl-tripeptide--D-alanyl-D-alanine ligase [Ignavibacterium sp.]|nr:UDP-N-acetylmuramoyl-tripeptide--D-alanyl-D-alanine ligase [Ignavibacterium sp.]